MPIPKPKPKEDQKTFISRCISAVHDADPERPQKQIIAITDLAWTAGIIDGEGSLAIGYTNHSKCKHWFCSVSVRNTNKSMIDKLFELFGGKVFKGKYKYKDEYRIVWTWYINPRQTREFLLLVYPYLITKKRQAEIILEMRRRIEEREGIEMVYRNVIHGHKSPVISQMERQIRNELYTEIKSYNRSGGYANT